MLSKPTVFRARCLSAAQSAAIIYRRKFEFQIGHHVTKMLRTKAARGWGVRVETDLVSIALMMA